MGGVTLPRRRAMVVVALAAAISSSQLTAQTSAAGSIHGRVQSAEGGPLADATVALTPSGGAGPAYATTDRTGAFRYPAVMPGIYRVDVQRIGYHPASLDSVRVVSGETTVLGLRLESAPRELDPLIAEAPAVTVDRLDPGFSRGLRPDQLAFLPAPADARNLIRVLPGVRPDHLWGAATAQASNYLLDGVPINHPGIGGDLLQPEVGWIDRIEVKGLGAGAEYGDFQGGLINVITRSGTDRFEGAFRMSGQAARFNGSNLRDAEIGVEPAGRLEVDGSVRGPLVKGRLFYALFGQLISRDFRVLNHVRRLPGILSPVGPEETQRKWLGKLNWQPAARDAVSLSVARFDIDTDRHGLDGFTSPEATLTQRSRTHVLNALWQRAASPRSFIEARAGAFFGSDHRTPLAGPDVPGQRTVNEYDPQNYGNAAFREYRRPRNLSLGVQWTLETAALGAGHLLKLGAQQQTGSWRFERLRNGGMTWRPGERTTGLVYDPALPATWPWSGVITSVWGGEVALDAGLSTTALYLQDEVSLGRLTLHLGARAGRWAGALATAVDGPRIGAVVDAAVEPRLGATLALNGRGTVLARAHWGQYHQGLFTGMFDRAAGSAVYSNEERWDYAGPVFGDPATTFTRSERDALAGQGQFEQVETITLNDVGRVENYRQPYVDQWVAGVEAAIGGRWKAEAVYLRRRNRSMVALLDRNLAGNYTVFTDVRVLDRFFSPVQWRGRDLVLPRMALANNDIKYFADLVAPPPGLTPAEIQQLTFEPDLVLTNVPEATRRFDQLQLVLEARYPGWWGSASAAFTRLDGNLNSVTGNDDASLSGAGPFLRLNEQFRFFGDLSNQSDIELKLQAGGRLPGGLRGGAYLSWFTGDVATPYLNLSALLFEFDLPGFTDLSEPKRRLRGVYASSVAGQRIFLEDRGSFQYGSYGTLDLRLERAFGLRRTALTVILDGFNVLGADTITDVQTSLTGDNAAGLASGYGRTRARLAPRTLRLSLAAWL